MTKELQSPEGEIGARDVVDRLGAEAPGELAHRRLLGHPPVDPDQAEAPQVQRI